MATLRNSRISSLRALLVDDMAGMRANLRSQLAQLGIADVVQASTATEALRAMAGRPFDLVLCDFNLGGETNGQQLLEYVREKKLLQPVTIWFMVTAEAGYDHVATTSDFAPDDYLIKPFTVSNLESRLLRHFERQDALDPALKRMATGDPEGAIAQFDRLVRSGSKFTMEMLRLKARCLSELNRHEEAKSVYAQALSIRQGLPWAELGFARALRAAGDNDKAKSAAASIILSNPSLIGAYELLAEIHHANGEETQSLEALRKAEEVVPSARRTRALGEMALRVGDVETAKAAYAKVVAAGRSSVTRNPYDSAALAQIYLDSGEAAKALEVLKPVQRERDYADETGFQAIANAVEARAHLANGDDAAAEAAMERALSHVENADPAAALAVSQACFALGRDAEGENIVISAVRANHEDSHVVAQAKRVLKDAGREAFTDRLVDAQVQEMLGLTERAVALARKAQLVEAQSLIEEAVKGLPNNIGVLIAAAQINLLVLSQEGMDLDVATRVRGYLDRLDKLAHGTERVVKMNAYFRDLLLRARSDATTVI